ALHHRGQSRQLKYQLNSVGCLPDSVEIGQVTRDQLDPIVDRSEIRPRSGAEVVQHANRMATSHQRFREMRTNEARSTGYQAHSHELLLVPHSTVTLLARLRGLSTSQPRSRAM